MSGILSKARDLWKRSMMHRALLVAPPVTLLILAAYWQWGGRVPLAYYTAKVEKGDIRQVVQATGTISAVTSVQVGSQVSGVISKLAADFNSKVTKGQVISNIDPAPFKARVDSAQADLENAKANVKSLEAQIDTQKADVMASKAGIAKAQAMSNDAKIQLKRTKDLVAGGIVAQSQLDTAQATFDSAEASVRVAEAQLEQSNSRVKSTIAGYDQAKAQVLQRKATYESAMLDLSHTIITAPIDGTVIARNVDVGQTVAASLSAPTLFVIAQDLTKMQVYAKTDEADVGKIRVDAIADFRVDSFPRDRFSGKVVQIRMNATSVQNVVTYDTIIEFDNPEQKLFPGMTAYVTIPVAWANDVVKLPNGAMRFNPEITPEEKAALYKSSGDKFLEMMADRQLAAAGGTASAQGSGRPAGGGQGSAAKGGGTGGGGQRGGGGGQGGGDSAPRRASAAGTRDEYGVVWMQTAEKKLKPVRVKLGVTDFTFTELKDGNVKPGDELIIGQSSTRASGASPAAGPGQQRGPMGGPGGQAGPGGMRRVG